MKKKLLFLMIIVMSGCSVLNKVNSYKNLTIIDFTKYTEKNFLITTEAYEKDYDSIGILNFVVRAGAEYKTIDPIQGDVWFVESIDLEDVLDEVYERSVDMGGNAIMNFKIFPNDKTIFANGQNLTIPGIEIRGFIINRK